MSLGLVEPGKTLSNEDIVNFLFMSGVSTAEEVTEVSGRGVGMDVVKRNIDSAGGRITVETVTGKGCVFKILLPKSVSTQIMDGFLVKAGNEIYVMPMELIGESFVANPEDVSTVSGKGELVNRRGALYPVVRLADKLEKNSKALSNRKSITEHGIMISVEIHGTRYAFCVDEIIGVQKVISKSIESLPVTNNVFKGAAIMGDGSIAMIIGVEGLEMIAE